MRSSIASGNRLSIAALAAIAAVAGAMIALAAVRWNAWTYGTDTGTFAQIAANAFHGFTDGPEGGSHFRFHWSPVLAVFYPLVTLTGSPLSLQIVQVLLIVCAAIPMYAIARAYGGPHWATRCAVLTLVYPPLLSIAFEEFHELALYPVLAIALIWAADRARWAWFAVFAVLLVLIREDVCVDLVAIGIALACIGARSRRSAGRGLLFGEPDEPERLAAAGVGLALLACGALAVYVLAVLPRAGPWAPSHFYDYPFARGPVQTALAVFSHPAALAASVVTLGRATYVLEALAPLALLPLWTRWSLLALPGFAGVLLASDAIVWRMGFHYSLLWAPWLLLAACWVLCRTARRGEDVRAARWWGAAVAICAIDLAAFNPMHPAHYLRRPAFDQPAAIARAFACVPRSAPVMTHDEWFAHVALAYPRSTILDERAGDFAGYVVYTPLWDNRHVRAVILPQLDAGARSGRFETVCAFGNVRVLRATSFRTTARRVYGPRPPAFRRA